VKLITKKQVVVRIAIIVSLAELLIMLSLRAIPYDVGIYPEAVLDTALLTLLTIPAIYLWIIKPFVDARDEALAQISHLALTDPVTHLANRRLIFEHLQKILTGTARHHDHGAVLLIDLDGFKLVNDNYGHEAGDAVLVEVAKRLQANIRSEDVVGRLGGDEFIVLLQRLGGDERIARDRALQFAEKLIDMINAPFDFKGKTLHVGASVGIRMLGNVELIVEDAISGADNAMYRAKQAGRGCAVFFE